MYKCNVCSNEFGLLEEHHIVPKRVLTLLNISHSDRRFIVNICGSCHNRVYIPGEKHGIHASPKDDSIIIHGWNNLVPDTKLIWENYSDHSIESSGVETTFTVIEKSEIEPKEGKTVTIKEVRQVTKQTTLKRISDPRT
jgi:hypothetical protein